MDYSNPFPLKSRCAGSLMKLPLYQSSINLLEVEIVLIN